MHARSQLSTLSSIKVIGSSVPHFLKSIIPALSRPISSSTTFHVCSMSVFCVSVNALGCCSRAMAVGRSQVGILTAAVSIFLTEQAARFGLILKLGRVGDFLARFLVGDLKVHACSGKICSWRVGFYIPCLLALLDVASLWVHRGQVIPEAVLIIVAKYKFYVHALSGLRSLINAQTVPIVRHLLTFDSVGGVLLKGQ